VYGLTENFNSYNPVTLILHEVRAMFLDVVRSRRWRQRLLHLFGPPGWMPREIL